MEKTKFPIFETVAKGASNPGSLDCESGILPLSYRAVVRCCCVNDYSAVTLEVVHGNSP